MASTFPTTLDNFATNHTDGVSEIIHAVDINNLADAVNKIEAVVGVSGNTSALRQWFNVRDAAFGASIYTTKTNASSGVDASAAINAAITAADAVGGGFVLIPGWVRASSPIVGKNNVTLLGIGFENSGIVFDDVANNGITWNGGNIVGTSSALSTDALLDTRVITVGSTASFAAGDDIYLTDNWQISGGIPYQEKFHSRIRTIDSGTVVTIEDPLPCTFHSANGAFLCKPTAGYWADLGAKDLTFTTSNSPGRSVNITYLVQVLTAKGVVFERCRFDGALYGMYIQFTKQLRIINCFFDHIFDRTNASLIGAQAILLETTTQAMISGNQSARVGSGIVVQWGCVDVTISNNVMVGANVEPRTTMTGNQTLPVATLNVVDTSKFPSSGTLVVGLGGIGGTQTTITYTGKTGSTFTGCSGGTGSFVTGALVASVTATNNDNGGRGLKTLGCSRITITNNVFSNFGDQGYLCEDASYVQCVGNTFEHFQDDAAGLQARAIAVLAGSGGNEGGRSLGNRFIGNAIRDAQGPGIFISGTNMVDCLVQGNEFDNCSKASGNVATIYCNTTNVSILGNQVRNKRAGDYDIVVYGGSCIIDGNKMTANSGQGIVTSAGSGSNKIGVNLGGDPYLLHATDTLIATRDQKSVYSGVGANQSPDASLAEYFTINITNATAFTINAPTNPTNGKLITFDIKNSSGGAMGVVTWNAVFKMAAWVAPGNTLRTIISFRYDGTNWVETARVAAI